MMNLNSLFPSNPCLIGPSRSLPPKTKGFTLIELLTVIAIIGILAAILIPVVGRVRDSAKASQCVSNLRQLGMATHSYAADNDDRFPPVKLGDGSATHPLVELFIYADDAEVFRCPTDPAPEDYVFYYAIPQTRLDTLFGRRARNPLREGASYMMAEGILDSNWGNAGDPGDSGLRLTTIQEPSRFGWMADGKWTPSGWNWFDNQGSIDRIHPEQGHPNGRQDINFLFIDGHVERKDIRWNPDTNPAPLANPAPTY